MIKNGGAEMKAKVVPIYFHGRNDREVRGYEDQLARIEEL